MTVSSIQKLSVFSFQEYHPQLVALLQESGLVHITDGEQQIPETDRNYFKYLPGNDKAQRTTLEKTIADLHWCIGCSSKYENNKGLLDKFGYLRQLLTIDEFQQLAGYDISAVTEQAHALEVTATKFTKSIEKKADLIQQLERISDLSVPLEEVADTKYTFSSICFITSKNHDWICTKLRQLVGEQSDLIDISSHHHRMALLVTGRFEKKERFLSWIENQHIKLLPHFELQGTSAENISRLNGEISTLQERLEEEYRKLAGNLPLLEKMYDFKVNELERLNKSDLLRENKYTVSVNGWIREDDITVLES